MEYWENLTNIEQITLFGALGNWVAAGATVAAVITAIYLAGRREAVKLRVTASEKVLINTSAGVMDKYLEIKITNIGLNTITLEQLAFTIGRGTNKMLLTALEFIFTSGQHPKLTYGETYEAHVSYENRPNWKANLVKEAIKYGSLRTLRVHVKASTGEVKIVRPDKGFIKSLQKIKKEL